MEHNPLFTLGDLEVTVSDLKYDGGIEHIVLYFEEACNEKRGFNSARFVYPGESFSDVVGYTEQDLTELMVHVHKLGPLALEYAKGGCSQDNKVNLNSLPKEDDQKYLDALNKVMRKRFSATIYCIGGYQEESVCMEPSDNGWLIYHGERGNRYNSYFCDTILYACLTFIRNISHDVSEISDMEAEFLQNLSEHSKRLDGAEIEKQRKIGEQLFLARLLLYENEKARNGGWTSVSKDKIVSWGSITKEDLNKFIDVCGALDPQKMSFCATCDCLREKVVSPDNDSSLCYVGFLYLRFGQCVTLFHAINVKDFCVKEAETFYNIYCEKYNDNSLNKCFAEPETLYKLLNYYGQYIIKRISAALSEGYDWAIITTMTRDYKITEKIYWEMLEAFGENEETIKTIEEARQGVGLSRGYNNIDNLMEDLMAEDTEARGEVPNNAN